MLRESQLLALGFPEAGKTTFLAALWHLAESEETLSVPMFKGALLRCASRQERLEPLARG